MMCINLLLYQCFSNTYIYCELYELVPILSSGPVDLSDPPSPKDSALGPLSESKLHSVCGGGVWQTGQLSENRNITTKTFLAHCFPLACNVMCMCVFVFSERADTQTNGDDDALERRRLIAAMAALLIGLRIAASVA